MPIRAVLRSTQAGDNLLVPLKGGSPCPLNAAVAAVTEKHRPAQQATAARAISSASKRQRCQPAQAQDRWAAPISRMASPPAGRATRPSCATATGRTSASSPPTTTCSRRISPSSAIPTSSGGGARGRRHGAGRGRRARHVRRRHPGRDRHGAVAVLARRDRAVDGGRAVAPDVRRGGLSRRLRQDRARPADRRAVLRPSAGGLHSGRADDVGPPQRREGENPPALCRRQGRPRRTARSRGAILSRAGHLHLLRHGQFQPDADGDHGPAPAGLDLRQSRHAAAR